MKAGERAGLKEGIKVPLGTKAPSGARTEREKQYLCFLCLKDGRRLSMKNINRHFADVH
jgi:hypothetical protein